MVINIEEGHFKSMLHSRRVDSQKIPHAQFVGIFIISISINYRQINKFKNSSQMA